jgi:hypothetical protein
MFTYLSDWEVLEDSIHYFHHSMKLAMTSALPHRCMRRHLRPLRSSGTMQLAREYFNVQKGHLNVLIIMKPAAASFIDFL